MLDREVVLAVLAECADNWSKDQDWIEGMADRLLGYQVMRDADPEALLGAIQDCMATMDRAPRVKDILERIKVSRAPRASSGSSGSACSECADGWIECQLRERCRDGVERLRKPLLVQCWFCRGGAGRGALVRGWEGLIRDGGGALVAVDWGAPLLRREAAPVSGSSGGWGYTPNPEQHDPHRAERERRRQWAAEQLEADAIRAEAKKGGASLEAILRAERATRRAA